MEDQTAYYQSDEETRALAGEDDNLHRIEAVSPAAETHEEYKLRCQDNDSIEFFRVHANNLPPDYHIRNLIGIQVYQMASCPNGEQCKLFCSECKFCCHQFYCTCQSSNSRNWCMHIHAAYWSEDEDKKSVVFVVEGWRLNRPELMHLRAMCYYFSHLPRRNNVFQVDEYSPYGYLTREVTWTYMTQMCSDCKQEKVCKDCNVCYHVLQCDCPVYVEGNLCEHCHVVGLYVQSNGWPEIEVDEQPKTEDRGEDEFTDEQLDEFFG